MDNPIRKLRREQPRPTVRPLPEPRRMDMALTDAFMQRHSVREFPDYTISDEELSTLLWAADGINRRDGRRTTPSAMNWQEVEIHVVKANGVWLWEPQERDLTFCLPGDRRRDICLVQPFIDQAPVHLVYVVNTEKTANFLTEAAIRLLKKLGREEYAELTEDMIGRAQILDVGVKVQAVYLAAAALGLSCLARLTFVPKRVSRALELGSGRKPVCIQTVGRRQDSFLGRFSITGSRPDRPS